MSDIDDNNPRCEKHDLHPRDCDTCNPGPRTPIGIKRAPAPMRIAHPVAFQTSEVTAVEIPTAVVIDGTPSTAHDYVTRLTEATTNDEPYTVQNENTDGTHTFITQRHRTSSPSLLEQLGSAIEPLHSDGDGMRVFASKTPARVEAIDALARIEHEAGVWLRKLNLPRNATDTPSDKVRRAAAGAGEEIHHDARRWWTLARTVTGWDAPAFRPDNTCPLCGVKGGLRVRVDALTAACVECGEVWDDATIQLLGQHIRLENNDPDDGPAHATGLGA